MKRTILVHVEVADEIDYAAAIKRIANSPEGAIHLTAPAVASFDAAGGSPLPGFVRGGALMVSR
jgi:hypothetical protein